MCILSSTAEASGGTDVTSRHVLILHGKLSMPVQSAILLSPSQYSVLPL